MRQIRCQKCGTVFAIDGETDDGRIACPADGCGQAYRLPRRAAAVASRPRSAHRWNWKPVAVASALSVAMLVFMLPCKPGDADVLSGASLALADETPPPASAPPQPDFATDIRPLLKTYCYDCHTLETQEGGLVIDTHGSLAAILEHREQWTKVFERIRIGAMPPSDAPQPTDDERKRIVGWLDHALFHVDCDGPPNPGRVTVRRLNRTEYKNTVRDLLGVDLDVSSALPQDDVGHGFDNIGDVLSVPPLLIEKYLAAAEQVAERAVIVPDERAFDRTIDARELDDRGNVRDEPDGSRTMTARSRVSFEIDFKKRGTYEVEWTVSGPPAVRNLPKSEIRVGPEEAVRYDILTTGNPQSVLYKSKVDEGRHRVSFALEETRRDGKRVEPAPTVTVHRLRVRGPLENLPDIEGTAPKVPLTLPFDKDQSGPGEPLSVQQAATATLAPLLRRAFRRPVTADEVGQFARFVPLAMERGDSYQRGIQVAVQAILVSPQFLFRVENGGTATADGSRWLTDHELASRMAYFLWSSTPDDELDRLADAGTLSRDETLRAQVDRMLADPKSSALIDNFASQWLALRKLFTEEVSPDLELFPEFSVKLRADMATETQMFFGAILRENRPLTDLIDARFTFVNERLANLYGIEGVSGEEFRRVELPDDRRRGLLTQASILTLTSYPNRTSPVKRGEWILTNLLGDKPPDPPPVVPGLDETQKANPDIPLRKQLELHRADPGCASCHKVMDELGFGLENYDAIGRWREKEGKFEIDSRGVLPTGETFRGATELTAILRAREEEFARCFAEKLLTFALGRGLEFYDKCAVDAIVDEIRRDDMRVSAAVLGIVRSVPFRMRGNASNGERGASAP